MTQKNFPLPIAQALSQLGAYLASHSVRYGRSGPRHRAMRCDRRKNILAVASAMLRGCSLQHDGLVCLITAQWSRPLCLAEIASLTGKCTKTVSRSISDMVDLGLITTEQIKRRNPITGLLEVSIGIRRFTPKFWQVLGLLDLYKKSVEWAKKHARRKLLMPFKVVPCKVKQAANSAASIVKTAMGNLAHEQAEKVKANCAKIRAMLARKRE